MEIEKYLVNIKGYKCNRCDHQWVSRLVVRIPARCPHCKSPYWNKKRKVRKKKILEKLSI